MEVSDWINLIAAILVGGGTLFLGIMAWRTIRQTRSIQKAERRERLLNEIIEWAENFTKHPSTKIFGDLVNAAGTEKVSLHVHAHIAEVLGNLSGQVGNSVYINKISQKFNKGLQDIVSKLSKDLDVYLNFLNKWYYSMSETIIKKQSTGEEHFKKADELARQTTLSAINVIEEATKIKIRDIG